MKSIGEGVVDRSTLPGTILDARTAGKRLVLDVKRHLDRAVIADEGVHVGRCRLDYRLRQGLARDHAGRLVLPPMVRAADKLVSAIEDGEPKRVHRATLDFYNARCQEMAKEFDRIARIRTAYSAMLVGIGSYNDDVFVGDNYRQGAIGSLRPWEIGLSRHVMEKLGVSEHDHVLISRYPTTRVIAVQVVQATQASDDVLCLPTGNVSVVGEITSVTDLLDGDRDGDCYVVRAVKGAPAKAELSRAFSEFWAGAQTQPLDRAILTWRDHQERMDFPTDIAKQKVMQKAAVGPITLDFYALFVYLERLHAAGIDTELRFEDIRQLMTDSLEGCFDLKHSNGADPMALHSLLTGVKTYPVVEESLMAQGFDMDKVRKVARLLSGQSVRKLAQENLPFAITQEHLDFNAVQRFVNSAPVYRPLEFVAALMVASRLKTPLSCDLVLLALRHARTLAEVYRDQLFSSLAD